jgi:abortive infection bacteriophage resistance protein
MDVIHFNTTYNHHKLLQKVQQETRQGDPRKRNAFCDYYYQTYTTPNLPPAWMVTEQLSMGTWSLVYKNLRQSRDKKDIARSFNVGPIELTSWIHALSYLRNLCAHHSRLLKINYVVLPQISPILPNSINHTKLIIFIAVIHYLLKSIPSSSEWMLCIKELLSRFSQQNHDDLIGFHTNWQNDSFWS